MFGMAVAGEKMRGAPPGPTWVLTVAFAMGLACIGCGVWCLREVRNGFLTVSPEGIERYSPWTGKKCLPWNTIVDVQVNALGAISLKGADGTKIKIDPTQWAGMDAIRDAICRHLA